MKHIFKIISLIFFCFFISICSIAQNLKEVKTEKDLQFAIGSEVLKHNDTISKYIKNSGVIYLRFIINNDGIVDSIRASAKQPKKFISVLTEALRTIKFPLVEIGINTRYFILPILYDYTPELNFPNTTEDLREMVPIFDLEDINSYINSDFNGLFNVDKPEKSLWGINCVLLPPIKVGLPRVYHHNNQKTDSNKKPNDKTKLKPNIR